MRTSLTLFATIGKQLYTDRVWTQIPSERELELLTLVTTERVGREVAKAYKDLCGKRILYGTVYAVFEQMAERKWVRIRQCDEGDRRVRCIKLTNVGAAAVEAAGRHYARLAHLADAALEG